MIEPDLRRALTEHYEAESLPDQMLERLLKQAEAPPRASRARFATGAILALAASVVLAVGLVRLSAARADRDPTRVARDVAAEIVSHEAARNPVQFSGANLASIQREMPRLDFRLAAPRRLAKEDLALVGARYCSLRGGLAAQIRLRDASGRLHNVYLCPVRARLEHIAEGEVVVDGSRVMLWREGGMLYGMTEG
jgi:hypothetical protein